MSLIFSCFWCDNYAYLYITFYYINITNKPHLIVLALAGAHVSYIDESVENLQALEIFCILDSFVPTEIPFDSLSKITNLKAISLLEAQYATNTLIPDSLCNLHELIYFDITFIQRVNYFPFDCVITNLPNLAFIKLEVFPLINYINPLIFNMPNLKTVLFDYSDFNISYFTFDKFNKFSNKLQRVSLSGAGELCQGNIIVNGTSYTGFEYLGNDYDVFTSDEIEQYPLLEFIVKYNPCSFPCDEYSLLCPNYVFSNGKCNPGCNTEYRKLSL